MLSTPPARKKGRDAGCYLMMTACSGVPAVQSGWDTAVLAHSGQCDKGPARGSWGRENSKAKPKKLVIQNKTHGPPVGQHQIVT